jgi:hypothetical protein
MIANEDASPGVVGRAFRDYEGLNEGANAKISKLAR